MTAGEGMLFCNQLFEIERKLKGVTTEERYNVRLAESRLILDAFSAWLKAKRSRVLPKSALGVAIIYCLNQWEKLVAFLKDGRFELNTIEENAPLNLWLLEKLLFSNTSRGAKASAMIYSIVESAKANNLNPFLYLTFLFEKLPQLSDLSNEQELDKLMPWSKTLPISQLGLPFLGMTGKFHLSWGEFGGFKNPNALRYEAALNLANGARCSIGDHMHPDGWMEEATYKLIGEAYREVETKEAWCTNVTPQTSLYSV
jgi:hypothetical protein